MTFLYLDTSALVKCYIAEQSSDDVIALVADAGAVATSLVTRTEVAAALAKAIRDHRLDADEAQRAHRKVSSRRRWRGLRVWIRASNFNRTHTCLGRARKEPHPNEGVKCL